MKRVLLGLFLILAMLSVTLAADPAPATPATPPVAAPAPPPAPPVPVQAGPDQTTQQRCPYCRQHYTEVLRPMQLGDRRWMEVVRSDHTYTQIPINGKMWRTCQTELNSALARLTHGEWITPK